MQWVRIWSLVGETKIPHSTQHGWKKKGTSSGQACVLNVWWSQAPGDRLHDPQALLQNGHSIPYCTAWGWRSMGQTGSETSGLCCPPRPPGSCHCGGRRLGRQCLCLGTEGSSGARPWPSGLGGGGWGGAEGSEEPAMPLQGHAEPGADRTVAPPPPHLPSLGAQALSQKFSGSPYRNSARYAVSPCYRKGHASERLNGS